MLVWKDFLFLYQFWILAGYSNLGCRFFPFSTLNIYSRSLLACRVSAERSAVKHMWFLLFVTCCLSLAAFNILSLCLIFVSLISMCLGVFLLGFILYGTLCASWTWLFPFPCWGKGNSQSSPRGTKSPIQDKPKEKHAKTHTNQTNKG